MEVVTLTNVLEALQNGTLDVGNLLPAYFPADFPNIMLIAEMTPTGKIGSAMVGATTEYVMTCPDCQKEFADRGLVFIAGAATPTYGVFTTKKAVKSVADLKGLRLRSPAGGFTPWIERVGAVPVQIPSGEVYEAMASGVVDGGVSTPADLVGIRLFEVVKYVTPLNIGTFHGSANFTARQATWRELTLAQRTAIVKAALTGVTTFEPEMRKQGSDGMKQLVERGGEIVEPAQDLLDVTEVNRAESMKITIENGKTRHGLADAEARANRYAALVDKWNKIIEPIQDDTAAMTKAIWDEVWSKVDLSTYGM
jgi:TRAP-type C4-dicarboxylate transport system substrate-binding protein